jgi:hypothetical protein
MLKPSSRTRSRFLGGLAAGCALGIFVPITMPLAVLVSLASSIYFRLRVAPQLLAGTVAFSLLWLLLLPRLGEDSSTAEGLIAIAFSALLIALLFKPGQKAALELMFRGRGLLGGWILASAITATVLSFAAALGVLLT